MWIIGFLILIWIVREIFLNYPYSLNPNFASKHTLSFVAKRFFTSLKTQVNASYTFNSGRPYYDIISQNGQNIIRNEGTVKDFSALNLSINYLPNLGKKNAKSFPVFVLSVNNVLNTKKIYMDITLLRMDKAQLSDHQ